MPQITLTFPHRLPMTDVRHRVTTLADQLLRQYGSHIERVEKRWSGNTLSFQLHRGRQSVSGQLAIQEHQVGVELTLPWSLTLYAGRVRRHIEEEGRRLLAG